MMREGKNWETQQKFIERTRKTDQQITFQQSKIYQKKREDSRRRQKLKEDGMRQILEKKKIQEKEVES